MSVVLDYALCNTTNINLIPLNVLYLVNVSGIIIMLYVLVYKLNLFSFFLIYYIYSDHLLIRMA